ncbi:glycoside hydrolase family 3 C-terminal domain-containing protein [Aquimarina celericrescens]|uniref:Glycoside hydrolase family 3 C-terminal domain-containing protein n=1 Tax=Aquimarina celericrescens TaxID=1964542 RepID=A0ABW5B2R0_9FLAO|nr:glycoside hydrolase family 3 C-terminal domain-containing protein [Aquimarina celericrescens]
MIRIVLFCIAFCHYCIPVSVVTAQKLAPFPWQNTALSFEARSEALVKALTLEEKVSLMTHNSAAIPRLNVPEYNWWNESLHGIARNGRATVFPQAIGLAATFDKDLLYRIATAISDEARAKFNTSIAIGNRGIYAGLTFWTPNINIFRDPRWGRGQETYGEDPFLTSQMATAYVKGLQGNHPKYLKAAACAKHYAVHSGPEELRHKFDAKTTKKDLFETYLPAFEALVTEAEVEGVMGAYNRVNGELACASDFLIDEVLKKRWNFNGYLVSDCWAIKDFWEHHKVTDSPEASAALALNKGLHVNCGETYQVLDKAIQQGLTTEKQLDHVLKQQLITRFKLGLFDPVGSNPYDTIPVSVVDSPKHRKLALEAARKSIVLLKNKNKLLPLNKNIKSVYVVGPHAASEEVLLGNYFGLSSNTQTILDGIVSQVSPGTTINYKQGILDYRENVNPIDWSTGEAKAADVCIAVMGISSTYEGEEGEAIASPNRGDRIDIKLPQHQIDYLKKIKKNNNKPLVLVLTGGSPIAIPELLDLVEAVVFVWYPGEEGGTAVGEVLFGQVSPSGKLPVTFPKSITQLPPYEDYTMTGRTYRYMIKDPLFPFGFGLNYADLSYSKLTVMQKNQTILVSAEIKNSSEQDVEEVAQLYISSPKAGKEDPIYTLRGFQRIAIKAKSTQRIFFALQKPDFQSIDYKGEPVIYPGNFTIYLGGSLPSSKSIALGAPEYQSETISLSSKSFK